MIDHSQWKWFGFAGHCIIGEWCRFHLTTQVGDYLISTVGKFVPPRESGGSEQTDIEYLKNHPNGETIGHERYYETMVFLAGIPCQVEGCKCEIPKINGENLDFCGYQTPNEATLGHNAMCLKWAQKEDAV
jgi:hypothetical protein